MRPTGATTADGTVPSVHPLRGPRLRPLHTLLQSPASAAAAAERATPQQSHPRIRDARFWDHLRRPKHEKI